MYEVSNGQLNEAHWAVYEVASSTASNASWTASGEASNASFWVTSSTAYWTAQTISRERVKQMVLKELRDV